MTAKTTRSKKQVEEADKSTAATGDLVADTGTEQGQAEPDTATEQVAVTEPAAEGETTSVDDSEPAKEPAAEASAELVPVTEEMASTQAPVTEQGQEASGQVEHATQEEEEKEASDTEQQVSQVDVGDDGAELILAVDANQPGWVIGHMDVKAKSPNGFWRCGCRFVREKATRVYVVHLTSKTMANAAVINEAAYVTMDEARRIYREPNLTILVDGEVIRG